MKTKSKQLTHLTIIKHYSPEGSTITKKHYTKFNEHPEDRIFRDKEYITRLSKHLDSVYMLLANDLRLNEKGKDWLHDYIYNCDEDIEFEEYLAKYDVRYEDIFDYPKRVVY